MPYVKHINYFGKFSALLRRATTYRHQNKLQEAAEDLRKVLDAEPDNDLAKVRTESFFP
jgi:predicted negative regulator of RcsB-dependent stress response